MLVIGHRGAKGLARENTLAALQAGYDAGSDILEFDVRVTKDKIPILSHDARLHGKRVSRTLFADISKAGEVTTLDQVFERFYGKILLNLEFKPVKDTDVVYEILSRYMIENGSWGNVLISSFHVRALRQFRKFNAYINLSLLHTINPLAFITYHRQLRLTAVGWHRLHTNSFAIQVAQRLGIFTYVYTVNQSSSAFKLASQGIDGIVTDYPNRLRQIRQR
jgi:glycerophosphoryl diester phosphodiesterase